MPSADDVLELPPPVPIGTLTVHPVTFATALDWIVARARTGQGGVVSTPNADHVVVARRNAHFRRAVMSADLRVPDGMGIVYAARLAGRPLPGTVTGRLLVPAVAERSEREPVPIALHGSAPGVATAAAERLRVLFPAADIVAALSPRMGLTLGSREDLEDVERLRASGARVIFVALGAPKQELWMEMHRDRLPGVVLVGVGAALDIVAGRFREAPRWMTRLGLEWLHRLRQEPRRLARRYLVDDPWIFWWALRTRLRSHGAPRQRHGAHNR